MENITKDQTQEVEDLEKIKTYCHLFPTKNGIETGYSYCGIPRQEQALHRIGATDRELSLVHCNICGLVYCPKCLMIRKMKG